MSNLTREEKRDFSQKLSQGKLNQNDLQKFAENTLNSNFFLNKKALNETALSNQRGMSMEPPMPMFSTAQKRDKELNKAMGMSIPAPAA